LGYGILLKQFLAWREPTGQRESAAQEALPDRTVAAASFDGESVAALRDLAARR